MVRVTRRGGGIVPSDAFAFGSDDPAEAAAFNAMERYRDQRWSSARSRFCAPGLRLPGFPSPGCGDRAGLRAMLDASVDGDTMGLGARWDGDTMRFAYPAGLVAVKSRGVRQALPGQTLRV
jgi:hypothetical protein